MKCFFKFICFIGGLLVLGKLAQMLIDFLYENYGKKYITADED